MSKKSRRYPVKSTQLDERFWRHFAAKVWEQKPLILKKVQTQLLEINETEIFDLLINYSNQCRKKKNPEGFKFYIDGIKTIEADVLEYLPLKKDKSLAGYHQRMNAIFNDYCLVCDELLRVNHQKQAILADFTSQLYRHVGFTNRFSELGLYLGNYRKTPFGVHVDNCGVFSFPIAGVKRFRLWSPQYVKKNPSLDRAFQYSKFKKDSMLLKAEPGDMTYWPSSAWHIAESDGSFSATWSLGVWVDQPHRDLFTDGLKELLDKKLGADGHSTTTPFQKLYESSGEIKALPPLYQSSIAKLQRLSATELYESFLKTWMIHISGQGFKSIPQDQIHLKPQSRLELQNKLAPILWQSARAKNRSIILLCFAGVTVEASKDGPLFKLIKDLNNGSKCLVSDYFKGRTAKQEFASLQSLADAGALRLI